MRIQELEKQIEEKDKTLEKLYAELDEQKMDLREKDDKVNELHQIMNKDEKSIGEHN
jgi:uncharacterized coiled-coil protein SlyX